MNDIRIGLGYDIHRLSPDRKLVLGGVKIEYEFGLYGHSDADVVAHAVMDALLGALSLGDIGHHFPDNDPAYQNADSIELLKKTAAKIKSKGYSIGNIDITIIAEKPKIAPHISSMKAKISGTLEMDIDQVSVKATTNEKIGTVGRGEGIAAMAVALLYK